MSSPFFRSLSALALSTSCLALGAPAFAQLDTIVVTAQKREQNLQDVPISINAFDLEAIETKRISNISDLAKFAPGVYTTPNPADETGIRINIRGIGTFDPQIGQDSRTAIYLDGIYYGRTQGLAFDSPDLGRVEILKGPQGTLYGRNAVSGAVNLISVAPNPEDFSGAVQAEYGNYNHYKFNGHVNLPLGEQAALRLSALYSGVDGWVENTGSGEDFGGTERFGGRAALRLLPTTRLSLDFAVDYTNTQSQPLFQQALPGTNDPTAFLAAAATPFEGRQEEVMTFADIERGETEIWGVSGIANYEVADGHNLKLSVAYREADSERFVALIPTANPAILGAITGGFNQALAPLPFAFQASGLSLRPDFATEFDGTPADTGVFLSPPGGASTLAGHEQFSAELTYTGSFNEGQFTYTGGLFYFDETTGNDSGRQASLTDSNSYLFVLGAFSPLVTPASVTAFLTPFLPAGTPPLGPIPAAGALLGILSNPATPPALLPAVQTNLATVNGINSAFLAGARQSAGNTLTLDTTAFAIYGDITWHISDRLRLSGGLRYSDDSKDGVGQAVSPFFLDATDLTGNPILPNIGSADSDSLDPSVILEYDLAEDILVYGSYKESFRSGGFNAAAVGLREPGQTFGADFIFQQENISAYEVGFKGDFSGGRFRLNSAAYYYDFTDFQTTVSLNPLIATSRAVVNTDQELWGVDVEALFAVTENLIFSVYYAYVDGNPGDPVNPLTGAVTVQDEIQGTPENSFTLNLDYTHDFSNGMEGFINASYGYKDEALAIPAQGAASEIRFTSQSLLSGRLGVNFEVGERQASAAFWVQNLLDDEYTIDGLPFNTFAYNTAVFGQPRTYGVSLGYKF